MGLAPIDQLLENWIADACRIANRELTEEEWRTYVGAEIPYQPVCGFEPER